MTSFVAVNENHLDRMVRVLLGVGILAPRVFGPRTWWGLMGLVPLLTGLAGLCPLYALLGISRWRLKAAPERTPQVGAHWGHAWLSLGDARFDARRS